MRFVKLWLPLVVCCLSMALACSRGFGQAVYGNIVGTVTDPSGAPVPGAKVTVTSLGQGVSFSTTTNASGNYQQMHLIVGTYSVKIDAKGFETFVQQNVAVNVDASTAVDVKLKLGSVTQTVNVTSAPPLIQTERTSVSTLYSMRSVKSLPILKRNFSYFELFAPGAQQLQWQHAASENPQGTIQMEVNGQEFGGTDWQLDGTDNHDVILGIMVVNPNIDSLSEVKVITADHDAEFPQADAGLVIAQTRSGTNQIHGSAFGFRSTDATTARDPFAQSVKNPVTGKFIPHTLWDQFGGSIGGPIKKDKTFFFGDYQGSRQRNGGSILVRVPTVAERAGNLSDLGVNIYDPVAGSSPLPSNPLPAASPLILPPAQRAQFAGNTIPTGMLSSQAEKMLALIPMPDVPGATGALDNYAASGVQLFDTNAFDVRIDQYQTDKLHLFGRYSFQQYYQQAPGAFGNTAGGPHFNNIYFAGISNVRTQSLAQGFDYTVSPNVLTDFRFGFFRYRVFVSPNGLGTTPATDAGIPGLNVSAITNDMPYFNVTGTGGLQFGYALGVNSCNCPLNEQEQQFQFVNNWADIHGNHTFKFGADIRRAMNLRVPSDSHRAGELTFNSNLTQGAPGGGLGLADFLLGGVDSFSRYVSNVTDAAERQTRMFYFGQDTWRVTPKLTLNYGLRWEIFFPQTVTGVDLGAWVNPTTGETMVAGSPGIGLNGGIRNSLTNYGPVAGIAYQVNPKTVVRMGYGRDFDVGLFGSVFGHTVTQNIPVLAQQSMSPSAAYQDVFSLSQGPPALNPNNILETQPKGINGLPLYPANVASPHVLPLRMRVPTVDTWNLTVQRELTQNTTVQLGWVGAKGTHVFAGDGPNYDINQPTINGYLTASLPGCPAPCTNARRPFYGLTYNYLLAQPVPGTFTGTPGSSLSLSQQYAGAYAWSQGIQWYGNDVSDNFESLQGVFTRRFSHGISVNADYTWGRCFDFGGGYVNQSQAIAYGPCDFQRTQWFSAESLVALPFGRGMRFMSHASRPVDYLLGGWQWNSVWQLGSGYPFAPSYTSCGSDEDVGICRPNLVGNAVLSNRTQHEWYKTSSVVNLANGQTSGPWQRPAVGQLGNDPWDSLTAPHYFQADMSLFKNFQIKERLTGQFRVEAYNIFNVANLGYPNGTVDSPTAGLIQGLAPGALMRNFQFAIRFDW
jgi:hypothetical protein